MTQPMPSPQVRTSVAAAVVVAAVVAGLVIVGVVVKLSAATLPTGPPLPPPPPTPVGLQYDPQTRQATYENLSITLATAPYECSAEPSPDPPAFSSVIACDALVHKAYQPNRSWYANTGFGLVPDDLAAKRDPKATATAELTRFRQQYYADDHVSVSKVQTSGVTGLGDAILLSARFNVRVPNLPTDHDSVTLVVVDVNSGGQAMFYSLRPNDASAAGLKALQDSVRTLKLS